MVITYVEKMRNEKKRKILIPNDMLVLALDPSVQYLSPVLNTQLLSISEKGIL